MMSMMVASSNKTIRKSNAVAIGDALIDKDKVKRNYSLGTERVKKPSKFYKGLWHEQGMQAVVQITGLSYSIGLL
jgi:hypothetical protein